MNKFFIGPILLKPAIWLSLPPKHPSCRILLLHNIDQMDIFEKFIDKFSAEYGFITPQDFERGCDFKNDKKRPKIMLTFDDGFLSSYQAAKQVLDPRGIKALFFIPANFIGLKGDESRDFTARYLFDGMIRPDQVTDSQSAMGWEEIKNLVKNGHSLGAHTFNHARLSSLKDQKIKEREIIGAADMLADKLGVPVNSFAYPFGEIESIDRESCAIIKKRFRFCYTGLRGRNDRNTNAYCILRDQVDVASPLAYNKLIIDGGLDIFYTRKRAYLKRMTG